MMRGIKSIKRQSVLVVAVAMYAASLNNVQAQCSSCNYAISAGAASTATNANNAKEGYMDRSFTAGGFDTPGVGVFGGGVNAIGATSTLGATTIQGTTGINANLTVVGNFTATGTKNFIHLLPNQSRAIAYASVEAGEVLTHARGVVKTSNGVCDIALPEHFALVTSKTAPLTVHLTPERRPALLYVESKSTEHIQVRMRSSDFEEFGDVPFSFTIEGIRQGYEGYKTERTVNPETGEVSDDESQNQDGQQKERVELLRNKITAGTKRVMETNQRQSTGDNR